MTSAAIMPIPAPTAGNAQLATATEPSAAAPPSTVLAPRGATGSRVNTAVAKRNCPKMPVRIAIAATITGFAARCTLSLSPHAGRGLG